MSVACTDEVDTSSKTLSRNNLTTRSFPNEDENPIPVEITPQQLDSIKRIQEYIYSYTFNLYTNETLYNKNFSSNLYAIEGLPITIEVKASGNGNTQRYFTCDGKNKEVKLSDKQNKNDIKQQFYIKKPETLNALGILLYSKVSGTPLVVGDFPKKKEMVLMTKNNDDYKYSMCDWRLAPIHPQPGYISIASNMCTNTFNGNGDITEIFFYALEVNSKNEIRFSKFENKNTQMFKISPVNKFVITDIQFDESSATINDAAPIMIKSTYENKSVEDQNFQKEIFATVKEHSIFNQDPSFISFNIQDNQNFNIPDVKAKRIVLPTTSTGGKASYLKDTNLSKDISFNIMGLALANSHVEIYSYLKTYNVEIGYTATVWYLNCAIKLSGIWKGTIVADPNLTEPDFILRYFDFNTGEEIFPNTRNKTKTKK